jgi:hypothetical protein
MAFAHSFPIDGTKPQDDDAFSNNAGLSRPEAANGEMDGAEKSSLTRQLQFWLIGFPTEGLPSGCDTLMVAGRASGP